jgi:hypothetical protein
VLKIAKRSVLSRQIQQATRLIPPWPTLGPETARCESEEMSQIRTSRAGYSLVPVLSSVMVCSNQLEPQWARPSLPPHTGCARFICLYQPTNVPKAQHLASFLPTATLGTHLLCVVLLFSKMLSDIGAVRGFGLRLFPSNYRMTSKDGNCGGGRRILSRFALRAETQGSTL